LEMNATFSPSASRSTHHRSAAHGWRRGDRCRALKRAAWRSQGARDSPKSEYRANLFQSRSPVGMKHGEEASRTCRRAAGLGVAEAAPISRRRG
jgi:hypothetical protein